MSTRIDILNAKDDLVGHQAARRCVTGGGCPERIALWAAYMATASRWGTEPGDKARVAEQYATRTQTVTLETTLRASDSDAERMAGRARV